MRRKMRARLQSSWMVSFPHRKESHRISLLSRVKIFSRFDEFVGFRAVPWRRAVHGCDLTAILVYEQGYGKAESQVLALQFVEARHGSIPVQAQVVDADFIEKALGLVVGAGIDVDGDNVEIATAFLALQLVESGHFLTAGSAPRRPKIDQQRLALVVAERHLFAVRAGKGDMRDGNRLFGSAHGCHAAG